MTAFVELEKIRKSFPGVIALDDVSLALQPGRIHGLVGENGAGKSTLINLLSGVLQPDAGQIRVAGHALRLADPLAARRAGIVAVHQEADLFPDLSVAENMALEQGLAAGGPLAWVSRRALRERAGAALATIGEEIPPMASARDLSPAQRQLVEIAAAVSQSARLLILDEPTSSLSQSEVEVLFGHLRRLRERGTAILYVSHRLEEIFALADEVTVLRDGRHVWTGPTAATTAAQLVARMVGRAKSGPAEERRTNGAELPGVAEEAAALRAQAASAITSHPRFGTSAQPPGPVVFSCRNLTAADGSFRDVSLDVRAGEVVGIYGLVGAGRSEWAQALFGLRALAGGEVRLEGTLVVPTGPGQMVRHGLAYVPEDRLRQGLCRGLAVQANVVLASLRELACGLWLPRAAEALQTRSAIERLAIRLRSPGQPAGTLSGGNQQKVVLGRWLEREPKVLVLDEPTRGVDVGAKAEIHALVRRLAAEGRGVVLISSELPEILAESDRVAVFRDGRLAAVLDPRSASAGEVAALALPSQAARPETGRRTNGTSTRLRPAGAGFLREGFLLLVLLALVGVLAWRTERFLEVQNLRNLVTDAALLSFCAVGAGLVILAGGIDISIGALMLLSAAVAGRLWEQGQAMPVVIAVAILIGGLGGLLNAALSLAGRIHPIVVTLGTWSLFRGLTAWRMQENVLISGTARGWMEEVALGLPVVAWCGLVLVGTAWLLLRHTVGGRALYALGSNPAAAHRVGIERGRVWLAAFTLQGVLVGLAGLLYLARSGGLQRTSYDEKTLEAIAAAVVGGVAITGGRGSVGGVALGCLLLVTLPHIGIFLGVATTWHRTLVGAVLVLAVTLDLLWRGTVLKTVLRRKGVRA
jgi:ABC-type sugar transport system ATPase subunit/ribose/xylose/arabinose/galactoside ABC-type transport system permease subunit